MMKQKVYVLMACVILILGSSSMVQAATWDYLPGGENYLNEDWFSLENGWYSSSNPFVIKPGATYTLTIMDDYHRGFGQGEVLVVMTYYDADANSSSHNVIYDDFLDNPDYLTLSYSWTVPLTAERISLAFLEGDNYFLNNGLSQTMMEEGATFSAFTTWEPGTIVDTSSPVFGGAANVISYVHSPISIPEIQSSLSAYDAVEGDLTSSIEVFSDSYTANMDTLGTYEIVFQVSDSSGNHSSVSVFVSVVDVLKPTFSPQSMLVIPYPQTMTVSEVKANLHASDNYDGDLSNAIVLEEDTYSANADVVGEYSMTFSVTDSSGNCETLEVLIRVSDEEAPIFSGTEEIVIGYDETILVSEILAGISVVDNYDTSLPIHTQTDTYTANRYVIGEYEVVFEATDSSGNQSTKTVQIRVVDEIGPIVYFDSAIIQTYDDRTLALEDFLDLLVLSGEILGTEAIETEVLYDSYSTHSALPGTYHLKLRISTDSAPPIEKDFEITVLSSEAHLYTPPMVEESSFFAQYLHYILMGALAFTAILSNFIWYRISKRR